MYRNCNDLQGTEAEFNTYRLNAKRDMRALREWEENDLKRVMQEETEATLKKKELESKSADIALLLKKLLKGLE